MRRPASMFTVLVGFVVPLLIAVGTPSAKPVERGELHDVFIETIEDFCDESGFTLESVFVFDDRFTLRSRGRDGLLAYMEHARSSQTFTNSPNGLSVVDQTRVLDKDLHVTDNGDGTLTIIILVTGPSSTLYGPNGKAIARNPGQVSLSSSSTSAARPPTRPTTSN